MSAVAQQVLLPREEGRSDSCLSFPWDGEELRKVLKEERQSKSETLLGPRTCSRWEKSTNESPARSWGLVCALQDTRTPHKDSPSDPALGGESNQSPSWQNTGREEVGKRFGAKQRAMVRQLG